MLKEYILAYSFYYVINGDLMTAEMMSFDGIEKLVYSKIFIRPLARIDLQY